MGLETRKASLSYIVSDQKAFTGGISAFVNRSVYLFALLTSSVAS